MQTREQPRSRPPVCRRGPCVWGLAFSLPFIQSVLGRMGTGRKAEPPAKLSATNLPHWSLSVTHPLPQHRLTTVQRPPAKRTNGVMMQRQSFDSQGRTMLRSWVGGLGGSCQSGMHQRVQFQASGRHSLRVKRILHSLG